MDTPPSSTRGLQLTWHGRTDVGKIRTNNEDAFLGLRFDAHEVQHLGRVGQSSMEQMDFAFAVSDGMGGAMAGEFASRITVEKVTSLLPKSFGQSAKGLQAGFADVLTELFDKVHRSLAYVGSCYQECRGMEATLSLCWFTPGWMYFGHVGDSRIYYAPKTDRTLRQLTQDDTYVGWLQRTGQINDREARTHSRRSVLQKSLGGSGQFVDPQVGAVAYEPGDLFLLCTDGLVDGLYEHHMLDLLRPADSSSPVENPAHLLVEESLGASGRDNTTALVIQVGGDLEQAKK
ncbi:MAG: serine/threonine-protein phosphatase [Verrucomicrobia bacterium]|nr:serine/threonine-protein phosphatase [Verrucomicrobiota bacterium]